METAPLRLLLVDDDGDDYVVTRDLVAEIGEGRYTLDYVETFEEALAVIRERRHDVYFFDYHLGPRTGLDLLRAALANDCVAPIILLTGLDDRQVDVEVMKAGAADYLIKGQINAPLFERTIRHAIHRKKLEDSLLQSQKLEVVGRLAGGIAHDFNNILTAVIGYSDLLVRESNEHSSASHHAQQIKKSAERAADLTSQLLSFSRKQIIQPKILNLNAIVAGMDTMLRRLIGENIELVILLADPLNCVKVDLGQIEQLLVHLAGNARDALPNGGRLTIQTANVTVGSADLEQFSGATTDSFVQLTISDNGTGMTEEVKAHLFEPFFTTKPQGKGTGLGLATCYGIVKQGHGFINVASAVGSGTTVVIHLPCIAPAAKVSAESTQSGPLPAGRETILVAEDEPMIRSLCVNLLRDLGYRVLEGSNGEEAWRVAQQRTGHKIDLLLTDVVMPLMGGKELADRFAVLYPHAPVIFTSGYTNDMIENAVVLDSCASFLQKPFTPTVFTHKVREILDASQAARHDVTPVLA